MVSPGLPHVVVGSRVVGMEDEKIYIFLIINIIINRTRLKQCKQFEKFNNFCNLPSDLIGRSYQQSKTSSCYFLNIYQVVTVYLDTDVLHILHIIKHKDIITKILKYNHQPHFPLVRSEELSHKSEKSVQCARIAQK